MSVQWWYAQEGRDFGPLPLERVGKLLMQRELDGQDWLWSPGMPAWAAAGTLPDFTNALREAGPSGRQVEPAPPPALLPDTNVPRRAGVWSRFLATSFDLLLANAIVLVLLLFTGNPVRTMGAATLWYVCLTPIILVLLGVSLTITGTTPGKALLDLRVRRPDGTVPDLGTAVQRQILLWVHGMALGIPIVGLFFEYAGKKRVDRARLTKWDADCGLDVYQEHHRPWRFTLVLAVLLLINLGLNRLLTGRLQVSIPL